MTQVWIMLMQATVEQHDHQLTNQDQQLQSKSMTENNHKKNIENEIIDAEKKMFTIIKWSIKIPNKVRFIHIS
jgi:hypothetical protein